MTKGKAPLEKKLADILNLKHPLTIAEKDFSLSPIQLLL